MEQIFTRQSGWIADGQIHDFELNNIAAALLHPENQEKLRGTRPRPLLTLSLSPARKENWTVQRLPKEHTSKVLNPLPSKYL